MAKFFVGQMVKLVKAFDPKKVGKEGRILDIFCERQSTVAGWPVNCVCDWTEPGYADHTDRLEPILPEGAQPSEFSFTELMDNLGVVVA